MFKLILVTDGCDISSENTLRWTSLHRNDDKSTLVQVMAITWINVDLDPCHHMASLGHIKCGWHMGETGFVLPQSSFLYR